MNKIIHVFIMTFVLLSFTTINAQFYYTRYVANKGNPGGLNTEADASTAGWAEIVSGNNSNNFWSSVQTIPFDFEFFGNNVTQFKVSQNGLVTFDASASALPDVNTNLPSADLPDSTIACFWDNFTGTPPTGTNDAIQTKIFGLAPNRQLWIRWFSFEYGDPGFSYSYFALVLEESSNSIYMVDMNYFYGSITSTVGIQLDNSTAIQNSDSTITFALGGTAAPDNDYYEFYIPKTNDVTVNNVSFSSFQGFPGVPITISAEIANLGTAAQSGFDIKYSVDDGSSTYNYSGTINSQEILTIEFPTTWTPAATGYPITTVYTELTGDENVSNDTSDATIEITFSDTLNFFEDFTTYNGNPTSIGWFGINDRDFGTFIPDINDGVWTYADFGNNPSFSRSVSNNLYNDFINNDWLISPALNMTTTAPGNELKFDIAVTPFETTDSTGIDPGDTIFVVASTNGITWSRSNILTYFTSNDVIMSTGTHVNLDLSAYDSEVSLYIGFYAYDGASTGGDYNIYIDNFLVGTLPSVDMEITSYQSIPGYGLQDSLVNFVIQVKNLGADPVSVDTFDLFVNGSLTSSIEYPALNSGESNFINVSYTATTLGENIITTAIRTLSGDINSANDTLSTSIPIAFYFEDFETGIVGTPGTLPTGWTNETDDDWDWYVDRSGTPSANTGPWVDHTLGTSSGLYLYTEASSHEHQVFHATSPIINVSGLTSPVVSFWYHMTGGDMGELHVDLHDGSSWHLDIGESLIGQQQFAQTDPWLMATADVSGFGNNIQLRFRGITNSWASDMAIDDISISEASALVNDIVSKRIERPVLSLVPLTQTSITTNLEIATSFYNQTGANTGDITLEIYDSTGAVVFTDGDIGVTIPSFGSSSFSYTTDVSGANAGEIYNAAIFASNFADPNASNDTSWAYPVTFGNQMGYDQGNWDVSLSYSSPGERTMFASRFDLLDDDVLSSVLIAIGTGNPTDSFSVDLFTNDADTPSVMLSRIYRGTMADVGAPAFVTFEAPGISLTAGDYWIVLDLDVTAGYPLGADRNALKPTYYPNHFAMRYVSTNWIHFDSHSFGNYTPLIRIGLSEISGIGDDLQPEIPKEFALEQNYPNPFNPITKIKYQLPKKSDIKIVIYNILGQAVRTLLDKSVDAGYQEAIWDGLNDFGNRVATGVYFYRVETKDFVKSKKMVLMK